MNVCTVSIGDELLIGQVIDSNSAWIAAQLNIQGLRLRHAISTGDAHREIIDTLEYAASQADVILMTGGLGPTKDDITKKALADMFGVKMLWHEDTWQRIVAYLKILGRAPREAHKEQCFMPANAIIMTNKAGTAPGMWFEENGKIYVSMPGVPSEMKYLMEYEVLPRLKARFVGLPIAHKTILTASIGESDLAAMLDDFENNLPDFLKLAYLPDFGQVRLRLTGSHENSAFLNENLAKKANELENIVSEYVYGYDTDILESVVGKLLKENGQTLSLAESCTGGYISHKITTVPGASQYFMGSIVAYAYAVKENVLGVKKSTLTDFGAVSEACVIEMVEGVLKKLKTDFAISISGIAGPSGETTEKAVGTIWIAVAHKSGSIRTHRLKLGRDRLKNIHYASIFALNMLRKLIIEYKIETIHH